MNASRNSRRTASPVRLALATDLTGAIGGAWWPRTGSMVRELPDLIEVLHPFLGEVIDISLNWSAASATPLMGAMPLKTSGPSHRLMDFGGRTAATRILVVPAVTPSALAMMVMRHAAARPMSAADAAMPFYDKAFRIVREARLESNAWDAERTGPKQAGTSTADGDA